MTQGTRQYIRHSTSGTLARRAAWSPRSVTLLMWSTVIAIAAGLTVLTVTSLTSVSLAAGDPGEGAHNNDPDSTGALLRAEVRDAEQREQQELRERISALEAQQQSSRDAAQKQQQLIEALQAEIHRLQAQQAGGAN